MKHQNCGGELKRKDSYTYRCTRCQAVVDMGKQAQNPVWANGWRVMPRKRLDQMDKDPQE